MFDIREDSDAATHRDLVNLLQEYVVADETAGAEAMLTGVANGVLCGLVAYVEELPVGCVTITRGVDTDAELGRLFVLQKYRDRGIGPVLVEAGMSWAHDRGLANVGLTIIPEQDELAEMLTHIGYDLEESIISEEYRDGESVVTLNLDLQERELALV